MRFPSPLVRLAVTSVILTGIVAGCHTARDDHHHARPAKQAKPFTGEYPIQIVCTTGPITEAVKQIGGPHVSVTGLMGPGIDPHLFRAAPQDVEHLQEADVIVYNGLHLEGRLASILEAQSKNKPVIAVTDQLVAENDPRLRKPPEFEGFFDPHVWHDALLWADCLHYLTEQMQKVDPSHAAEYQKNHDDYIAEITAIDDYCRTEIATLPEEGRILVTAHDAFGYFSAAYGLETEPLKGVSTEDEVDIGRLDDVVDLLIKQNIPAVFVESAISPRIVRALIEPCEARGHKLKIGGELYADALGPAGTDAETYPGMLRANVDTIVTALTPTPGG